jgi:hypothetical protein
MRVCCFKFAIAFGATHLNRAASLVATRPALSQCVCGSGKIQRPLPVKTAAFVLFATQFVVFTGD